MLVIKNFNRKSGDHRIAMCGFILSILTNANTSIKNFETVYTSSPSFLKIMRKLGAKFEIKKNYKLIIAADGSAASGKTTGAKLIAKNME